MGYDHFALLAVPLGVKESTLNKLEKVCAKLKNTCKNEYDYCLFGKTYHLVSGCFNEWWWTAFDNFISQLYKKTKIPLIYIYVCEFDGESLKKYSYKSGKREQMPFVIKTTINDPNITQYWNLESLIIKNNITIFYNDEYPFSCEYC